MRRRFIPSDSRLQSQDACLKSCSVVPGFVNVAAHPANRSNPSNKNRLLMSPPFCPLVIGALHPHPLIVTLNRSAHYTLISAHTCIYCAAIRTITPVADIEAHYPKGGSRCAQRCAHDFTRDHPCGPLPFSPPRGSSRKRWTCTGFDVTLFFASVYGAEDRAFKTRRARHRSFTHRGSPQRSLVFLSDPGGGCHGGD